MSAKSLYGMLVWMLVMLMLVWMLVMLMFVLLALLALVLAVLALFPTRSTFLKNAFNGRSI